MQHEEPRSISAPLLLLALSPLLLSSCASAPARSRAALVASAPATTRGLHEAAPPADVQQREPWSEPGRTAGLPWANGQALLQGFVGYTSFEKVEADGDTSTIDGDRGDLDQLPLIGGGAQWKFGGRRFDFGLEGLLSFAGSANAAAVSVGGSGTVVAVSVDLLLFDLYGGAFASVFLGDKLRLYGAAGPLLQWAEWDQSGNALDDNGSGFGVGTYARTGFEFVLPSHVLVGLGVRWSDSSVDLGGDLGDLDIEGFQGLFTVSRGL